METFRIKCMDKEIEILKSTAETIPAFKAYLNFTKNSEKPYFIEYPAKVFYEFLDVINGRCDKINNQVFTLGDELAYWTYADGRTQKIEVWPYFVGRSMENGSCGEFLLLNPCRSKTYAFNSCSCYSMCCCISVNENYIHIHGKFKITVKAWCSVCGKDSDGRNDSKEWKDCEKKHPDRYYKVEKTLKTEFPRGVIVMPRLMNEKYL